MPFLLFLLSLLFLPTPTVAANCPLQPQQAYRATGQSAVYYITTDCTKRAFQRSDSFFTYFASFDDVIVLRPEALAAIPADTLGFMPLGPRYNPQYGALVKSVTDPKVYLLLGNKKYWITDAAVFEAIGYPWSWIEDVDVQLLNKYPAGGEITDTTRIPEYTLVKSPGDPTIYRVEADPENPETPVYRAIPNEQTFVSLGFRWDRVLPVAPSRVRNSLVVPYTYTVRGQRNDDSRPENEQEADEVEVHSEQDVEEEDAETAVPEVEQFEFEEIDNTILVPPEQEQENEQEEEEEDESPVVPPTEQFEEEEIDSIILVPPEQQPLPETEQFEEEQIDDIVLVPPEQEEQEEEEEPTLTASQFLQLAALYNAPLQTRVSDNNYGISYLYPTGYTRTTKATASTYDVGPLQLSKQVRLSKRDAATGQGVDIFIRVGPVGEGYYNPADIDLSTVQETEFAGVQWYTHKPVSAIRSGKYTGVPISFNSTVSKSFYVGTEDTELLYTVDILFTNPTGETSVYRDFVNEFMRYVTRRTPVWYDPADIEEEEAAQTTTPPTTNTDRTAADTRAFLGTDLLDPARASYDARTYTISSYGITFQFPASYSVRQSFQSTAFPSPNPLSLTRRITLTKEDSDSDERIEIHVDLKPNTGKPSLQSLAYDQQSTKGIAYPSFDNGTSWRELSGDPAYRSGSLGTVPFDDTTSWRFIGVRSDIWYDINVLPVNARGPIEEYGDFAGSFMRQLEISRPSWYNDYY